MTDDDTAHQEMTAGSTAVTCSRTGPESPTFSDGEAAEIQKVINYCEREAALWLDSMENARGSLTLVQEKTIRSIAAGDLKKAAKMLRKLLPGRSEERAEAPSENAKDLRPAESPEIND